MSRCQLSVANLVLNSAGLFCFKLQWLSSSASRDKCMSWLGQLFHLSPILRLNDWSKQFLLMTVSSLWCPRVNGGDFPGGPVVKTLHCQCSSILGWWTKITHAVAKKKKKKGEWKQARHLKRSWNRNIVNFYMPLVKANHVAKCKVKRWGNILCHDETISKMRILGGLKDWG